MALRLSIDISTNGRKIAERLFNSEDHKAIKIGTLEGAHLRLEDPRISGTHAIIELTPKQATLRDMSALVGTYLNGDSIQRAVLKDGDVIKIGDTTMIVGIERDDDAHDIPNATGRAASAGRSRDDVLEAVMGLSKHNLVRLDEFLFSLEKGERTVFTPPAAPPEQMPERAPVPVPASAAPASRHKQAMPVFKDDHEAFARSEADDSAMIHRSAHRERKRKIIVGVLFVAVCIFVVAVIIKAVGTGEGKREELLREHNQKSPKPPAVVQPNEPEPKAP